MTKRSRTTIQPVGVLQLVSRIMVPGRYRRAAGIIRSAGPNRKKPASRSSRAPKTLGESTRGKHSHSTLPPGATSAWFSQSDRKPYSPIGGKEEYASEEALESGSSPGTAIPQWCHLDDTAVSRPWW